MRQVSIKVNYSSGLGSWVNGSTFTQNEEDSRRKRSVAGVVMKMKNLSLDTI